MFSIQMSALHNAVNGLAKVIPNKVRLPILGAVRISAGSGMATLSGTDLEQRLAYTTEATATEPADIAVEFRALRDLVKAADSSGDAVFTPASDGTVRVEYQVGPQRMSRTLATFAIEDLPVADDVPFAKSKPAAIGAEVFARLRSAIPSCSKDDTRRTVTGVLLEPALMVATDGKHLLKLAGPNGVTEPVIVPVTKVLAQGLLSREGTVAVGKGDIGMVRLTSGEWTYTVKTIVGPYPNWRQIVPGQFDERIEFDVNDAKLLTGALPALPTKSEYRAVYVHAAERVSILAEDLDNPSTIATAAKYTGRKPGQVLCANRQHLIRSFSLGFRHLAFNDPLSPVAMHGGNPDAGIMVFMPLKCLGDEKKLAKALEKAGEIRSTEVAATSPVGTPSAVPRRSSQSEDRVGLAEGKEDMPTGRSAIPGESAMPQAPCPMPFTPHPATHKESQTMTEDKKPETTAAVTKPQFQMTGEEVDPFTELLNAITETQEQARQTLDKAGKLAKLVRETQRAVKAKEKDFTRTQRLIADLKKVSGF
jgi:DNA polymerase-3 subunit beta